MTGKRTSAAIDIVANSLTKLGRSLPGRKQAIRDLLIRLDRVSNQLDRQAARQKQAGLPEVEQDLERAGLQYSIGPGAGKQGATYFIPRGQVSSKQAIPLLKKIAAQHGATLDESVKSAAYKLSVQTDTRK